jgi:hypothetical protein
MRSTLWNLPASSCDFELHHLHRAHALAQTDAQVHSHRLWIHVAFGAAASLFEGVAHSYLTYPVCGCDKLGNA